jgi:hypothetical protein
VVASALGLQNVCGKRERSGLLLRKVDEVALSAGYGCAIMY